MALYTGDQYDTFRMLAVDPGKYFLGASIHELDSRTGKYKSIRIETLKVDLTFQHHFSDVEFRSRTDSCLLKIRKHVSELCMDYSVSFFAYESPFFNPIMPGAYGSLCEVAATMRQAAIDVVPNILIDCMSPQNVKKGMGAGGSKGKLIMYEKVVANLELMQALEDPIENLTEHCVDSIAVGYNARNTILAPMEGWSKKELT